MFGLVIKLLQSSNFTNEETAGAERLQDVENTRRRKNSICLDRITALKLVCAFTTKWIQMFMDLLNQFMLWTPGHDKLNVPSRQFLGHENVTASERTEENVDTDRTQQSAEWPELYRLTRTYVLDRALAVLEDRVMAFLRQWPYI